MNEDASIQEHLFYCLKRFSGPISLLIYLLAASAVITGIALTLGAWKPLFEAVTRINPVSPEFRIQLADMIRTIGPIGMLSGTLLFFAKVVLSGQPGFRKLDLAVTGAAALAIMAFFAQVQPVTSLNGGLAWDGTQYYSMFHYFKNDSFPVIDNLGSVNPVFPYNQRVLVPWLAAHVPLAKVSDCFRMVNTGFLVAAAMALYVLWVRLCAVPKYVALLGLSVFMFHWIGPFRTLNNCVFSVDAPVYLFETLLLCAVYSRRYTWLLLIAPLATLCKEQFVYIFLVLVLYSAAHNRIFHERKYPIALFTGATVLAFAVNAIEMRFPFKGVGFGGFTVAFFAWRRLYEPLSLVRWAVALFTAYGAIGMLSLITASKKYIGFVNPRGESIALSVLFLVFSLCGATDMTRVAFLGFPFITAWALPRVSCHPWQSVLVSAFLTIPIMRLVQNIPEPTNPLPCNDQTGYYSWMPEYADLGIVTAWGLFFVVCWVLLSITRTKNVYGVASTQIE